MGHVPTAVAKGTPTTIAALCGNDGPLEARFVNLDHTANVFALVALGMTVALEVSPVADFEVATTITFGDS